MLLYLNLGLFFNHRKGDDYHSPDASPIHDEQPAPGGLASLLNKLQNSALNGLLPTDLTNSAPQNNDDAMESGTAISC